MTDELVLDAVDQRVLGSLLEKQRTVPGQLPDDAQRPADRVQPVQQPGPGRRLRPAAADRDAAQPQGARPGPGRVGRPRAAHAEVPPAARRAARPPARRAGADHRAAAARPAGAGRAAHPYRPAAPVRRPRGGGGGAAADGGAARPRWCASWSDGRASRTADGCTSSGRSRPEQAAAAAPARRPRESCSPRERLPATRRCGRRTTRWRRRTPSVSATSSTASPSTAGCSDRVAALAGGLPVVDVGTGPGHVAAYLAAAGADVTGVDLSPAMVDEARDGSRT